MLAFLEVEVRVGSRAGSVLEEPLNCVFSYDSTPATAPFDSVSSWYGRRRGAHAGFRRRQRSARLPRGRIRGRDRSAWRSCDVVLPFGGHALIVEAPRPGGADGAVQRGLLWSHLLGLRYLDVPVAAGDSSRCRALPHRSVSRHARRDTLRLARHASLYPVIDCSLRIFATSARRTAACSQRAAADRVSARTRP